MIRNIWCIGRSYAEHAVELGNEVPQQAMIFLKAGSCATEMQTEISLANHDDEFHYELELALRFDHTLSFSHYSCAIDLTNRSAQNRLKKKAHPWTLAKSFKGACPIGPWREVSEINLADTELQLTLNGQVKQQASTRLLLFPIEKMREYLIANYPVCPGDVYLSGTPSGVGPLNTGDKLEAHVGKAQFSWVVR